MVKDQDGLERYACHERDFGDIARIGGLAGTFSCIKGSGPTSLRFVLHVGNVILTPLRRGKETSHRHPCRIRGGVDHGSVYVEILSLPRGNSGLGEASVVSSTVCVPMPPTGLD